MTTIELLRQRAGDLARRLDTAGESQLRRVTAAIAKAAAERVGLSHPVIAEALAHLSAATPPHPSLRGRVQRLAEQLDAEYFALSRPYDERDEYPKTAPEVGSAFSKARAASAVATALGSDAFTAAADAAYEAVVATDDSEYLTAIADRILSTR
jgi:hypothetical protein